LIWKKYGKDSKRKTSINYEKIIKFPFSRPPGVAVQYRLRPARLPAYPGEN
jgi:hypothetical protein